VAVLAQVHFIVSCSICKVLVDIVPAKQVFCRNVGEFSNGSLLFEVRLQLRIILKVLGSGGRFVWVNFGGY
jgi:hypothetical protein